LTKFNPNHFILHEAQSTFIKRKGNSKKGKTKNKRKWNAPRLQEHEMTVRIKLRKENGG
jgi:hypothetical protein